VSEFIFPSEPNNAIAARSVYVRLQSGGTGKRGSDIVERKRASAADENRVFDTVSGSERNEKGNVEARARVITVNIF
jgi:hypothetical protein